MRNPAYLRGAMAFGLASVVGLAIFLSSLQMVPLLILGSGLLARLVVIPGLLVGSLMVGSVGSSFPETGLESNTGVRAGLSGRRIVSLGCVPTGFPFATKAAAAASVRAHRAFRRSRIRRRRRDCFCAF